MLDIFTHMKTHKNHLLNFLLTVIKTHWLVGVSRDPMDGRQASGCHFQGFTEGLGPHRAGPTGLVDQELELDTRMTS